jgi:DNA-binding beta-propeller fold protein YncE
VCVLLAVCAAGVASAGVTNCAVSGLTWAVCYDGPAHGNDGARAMAVSPDGKTVFVTGPSAGNGTGLDYATEAINAQTGASLWVRRYNGLGGGDDQPIALAVAPDGSSVFVTGTSLGSGTGDDFATQSLNAKTGAVQWVRRDNGAGNGDDYAAGVAVSPDGSRVYVTGDSYGGAATGADYTTIAYTAATGATDWKRRYAGAGSDTPAGIAVAPDGSKVFVTGSSSSAGDGADYFTIAYTAAGKPAWQSRHDDGTHGDDTPIAVAVNPASTLVFITGTQPNNHGPVVTDTFAYNAATGARVWNDLLETGTATSLALSPDGQTAFVTNFSPGLGRDCTIAAYAAADGAMQWARGAFPPTCVHGGIAVSGDGESVFVDGSVSSSYAVQQWAAADGTREDFFSFVRGSSCSSYAVAVSKNDANLYVTGECAGTRGDTDLVTVATPLPLTMAPPPG